MIARFRELAITYIISVWSFSTTPGGAAASPGDPNAARRVPAPSSGRFAWTDELLQPLAKPTRPRSVADGFRGPRNCFVRLDDAKLNDSPIGAARWFEKVAYTLDNGEVVPAAVPWTPPAAKVASQEDLAALAGAIERGSPTGEPWSPKLSGDQRSVRHLLEQHGFIDPDGRDNYNLIEAELALEIVDYKRPTTRKPAKGLRIGDKPAADLLDGGIGDDPRKIGASKGARHPQFRSGSKTRGWISPPTRGTIRAAAFGLLLAEGPPHAGTGAADPRTVRRSAHSRKIGAVQAKHLRRPSATRRKSMKRIPLTPREHLALGAELSRMNEEMAFITSVVFNARPNPARAELAPCQPCDRAVEVRPRRQGVRASAEGARPRRGYPGRCRGHDNWCSGPDGQRRSEGVQPRDRLRELAEHVFDDGNPWIERRHPRRVADLLRAELTETSW